MHTLSPSSSATIKQKVWAIVPASGKGSRMALDFPKQYLTLLNKTVLEHTLNKLNHVDHLEGIVVVISAQDSHFEQIDLSEYPNIHITYGGSTRAQSVYNGLNFVKARYPEDNLKSIWALVHDCARPCVQPNAIEKLMSACLPKNIGGILAAKVADTVKLTQTKSGMPLVSQTQDRSQLWLAQTPQLFLLNELSHALQFCKEQSLNVTDEASAMEQHNKSVQLIENSRDNIKITTPEDITIATAILSNQQKVRQHI